MTEIAQNAFILSEMRSEVANTRRHGRCLDLAGIALLH